eukprot:1426609-Heterocapsa_arctica.AAC.1
MESDHRLIGVAIGWGSIKSIHIMSIYGLDVGKKPTNKDNVLRQRVGKRLFTLEAKVWQLMLNLAPRLALQAAPLTGSLSAEV